MAENTRNKVLNDWLYENDACVLTESEVPAGNGFRRFAMYSVNGKVIIIQRELGKDGEDQGWRIWLPAANSNDIKETLAAVEKHCGTNTPEEPQPKVTDKASEETEPKRTEKQIMREAASVVRDAKKQFFIVVKHFAEWTPFTEFETGEILAANARALANSVDRHFELMVELGEGMVGDYKDRKDKKAA